MARTDVREGRLVVSVPEHRYFRLEDSSTYKAIKGQKLTEVDFAWMIDSDEALWLMELKDFGGRRRPTIAEKREELRNDLPKNIAHALLLVSTVWADTRLGRNLKSDIEETFPDFPKEATPIHGIAVIHADQYDSATIGALTTSVRSSLSAFGLETVAVLPASSDRVEDELGIEIRYAPE